MCLPLNSRNQEIGEEETGVADADITDFDSEEDDEEAMELQAEADRLKAESDRLRAELRAENEEFKENLFLIGAVLEFAMFHDLNTEKGLLHVNMVLDILGEEQVLEENWGQLISEQKKEVFEILLKLDYEKEIVEGIKSEERIKAIADISAIIFNNNKGSLEVDLEESFHDVENLKFSESSGSLKLLQEINMLESEADDSKVEKNNIATENAKIKSAIEPKTEQGLFLVDKALGCGGQERVLEDKLKQPDSSQEINDENPGEEVVKERSVGILSLLPNKCVSQ